MGKKHETNIDDDLKGSETRCDSHDLATLARSDCSKEFRGTKRGFRGRRGVAWYFVDLGLDEDEGTDANGMTKHK